ncbi:MAG: hypothetical protein JWQ30_266 [Sediminibacterium sp.]|nr:hypothetical protein [Sediminibacterium sp.]
MRIFLATVAVLFSTLAYSQDGKVYDAKYLSAKPMYPPGIDSCRRFYFAHFNGFDSVLYKVVTQGDTAKYIRIYFSFVIDKYGFVSDAHFEKIASTQYAKSATARMLKYFSAKEYYNKLIKDMLQKMPSWKPALLYGVPVDCKMNDYFQFRVGAIPPDN